MDEGEDGKGEGRSRRKVDNGESGRFFTLEVGVDDQDSGESAIRRERAYLLQRVFVSPSMSFARNVGAVGVQTDEGGCSVVEWDRCVLRGGDEEFGSGLRLEDGRKPSGQGFWCKSKIRGCS